MNYRKMMVLNWQGRLKHRIGIFFNRFTLKSIGKSLSSKKNYRRFNSMRYPESPKVTKEHHPNHPNLIRSVELRKLKDKKDRTFHPSTVAIDFST